MMSAARLDLAAEGMSSSRLRVEKERSAVAVVMCKVTSTCSRMDRFGYRDALHATLQPCLSEQHVIGLVS